ncbi:MAG: hypothetical protein NTW96_20365 [Planctomycetia bacterium]|nr:hypothetical protein [Planctomycetia bacterium]
MNATILRRLVWKEYRTTVALWLAMVGLCFFLQLAVVTQSRVFLPTPMSPEDFAPGLYGIALFVTALYALACSGMQYALEHENKTFGLLRSLPLSVREVAVAKTGWAILTTAALAPVLGGMAFLFTGGAGLSASDARHASVAFGIAVSQGLAWGTFFSLLSSRPMVAILRAGAAVTVCLVTVSAYFDHTRYPIPLFLLIFAVVAAVDVWLALRWFEHWKVGRKRLQIVETLSDGLGGSWAMPFRSRRGEFVGLCLHHMRQSSAILGLCALIVLVWFVGRLLVVTEVLPKWSEWYGFAALSIMLGAIVYPSLAFHADQRQRGYRFLSHHGVTPRKAWWSRQLVWGTFYLLLTGLLLLSLVMGAPLRGVSLEEVWNELFTRPDERQGGFTFIVFWVLAYACGALVSILLRSGILAVALGATLTVVLLSLCSFFGWYIGWAPVWLIPLGLLVASRLHAADWLAERRNWRSRLRWITPAVAPLVFLLAVTPYLRIHQIPYVSDPGFSPSRLESQTYSPEGVARLAELVAIAGLPRETIVVDEPGDDPEGKKTEQILSDNAVKRLVAFTADWPKPSPCHEGRWMDSWAYLAETPAGRLHPGPFSLVVDLIRSFGNTMRHYEATGRPREALDCRIAISRLGMGMGSPDFGQNPLANVRRSARGPGMTPELLKEAISRLDELAPDRLDYAMGLKLWYLVTHRDIADDDYFFMDIGERPTARVLLPILYPWERTRGLRRLRYELRQALDRLELFADSCADPNTPSLDLVWDFPPVDTRFNDWFEQFLLGTGVSAPLLNREVLAIREFEVARRRAQAELAVEAWRLEHDGKLPESLDQLVGVYLKRRPVNPVTKRPFRLEPIPAELGGEYMITSQETVVRSK